MSANWSDLHQGPFSLRILFRNAEKGFAEAELSAKPALQIASYGNCEGAHSFSARDRLSH